MSNETKQQAVNTIEESAVPDADSASVLSNTRTEIDRMFATAAKSFESLTSGDSNEFLKKSRQTGGQ